jgi:23S rRNA (uracil1939-C5)-methyltransferase
MSGENAPAQRPATLRIEKAIYGGAGLARDSGKAVFVPLSLPGELVTVLVTSQKPSFAEAALERVLEPSVDRIAAPCPYFGACGGCQYQHARYPAQLAIKAAILEETLTRAHLASLPELVTHAGQPFGYRNRIRLHFDPVTSALAYRQRGGHRLIAVDRCPIAAPELEEALVSLAEIGAGQQCGSSFSQAELSVNHDGSELLLALWLREDAGKQQAGSKLSRLCEALKPRLPLLRGAGVYAPETAEPRDPSGRRGRNSANVSAARRKQAGQSGDRDNPDSPAHLETWGTPWMMYKAAGFDYRVSLGAFFQVNRTLVDTLAQLATDGRSGALAWDLYAGVGLFSRSLADRFSQVVAVEGAPVSCADLRHNLASPHLAVCSGTLDFLRREALRTGAPERRRPDFVLVDPPRAGLGEEVTRLLAQIGPPEVTYVSCDPATLSRDLHALVNSGYKLQQLHLIDLFPQTFHLETVATLSRR